MMNIRTLLSGMYQQVYCDPIGKKGHFLRDGQEDRTDSG